MALDRCQTFIFTQYLWNLAFLQHDKCCSQAIVSFSDNFIFSSVFGQRVSLTSQYAMFMGFSPMHMKHQLPHICYHYKVGPFRQGIAMDPRLVL